LPGLIGGKMAGTNTYNVCIVFNVESSNDDEALETVMKNLQSTIYPLSWAWIYTTQTKESDATS
jgi:hypothetical protein